MKETNNNNLIIRSVTEVCPHCGVENTFDWDLTKLGYKAFCTHCGKRLMFCSECDNRCDYRHDTDTCKHNMSKGGSTNPKATEIEYKATNIDTDKMLAWICHQLKNAEAEYKATIEQAEIKYGQEINSLRKFEQCFYCDNYEKEKTE